jgi:hypothetical protein
MIPARGTGFAPAQSLERLVKHFTSFQRLISRALKPVTGADTKIIGDME